MNHAITLYDKTEIIVSDDVGSKLMDAIASDTPPEYVTLNGSLYKATTITSIVPTGQLTLDQENEKFKREWNRLPSGPYEPKPLCGRAQTSIQAEINKLIKTKYPTELSKLGDKGIRSKLRKELMNKYPNRFCDYRSSYHTDKCIELSKVAV